MRTFVNNTPITVSFLPILVSVSLRSQSHASSVLVPEALSISVILIAVASPALGFALTKTDAAAYLARAGIGVIAVTTGNS